MPHSLSLSQRLVARYFALLLITSGVVSALVHPLPNLTGMGALERAAITVTCVVGGVVIWFLPWDRYARWTLFLLPPIGFGIKMWANLHGGLGPYSYSIHFVLIYVWMGIALPRWSPLTFTPLMVLTYVVPLALRGDPSQTASVAMVAPICLVIGESVAWISNRLREVEQVDAQRMRRMQWLLEASVDLAHQHERSVLVGRIARLAVETPNAIGAAVLLPGPGRTFEPAASIGWPDELPARLTAREVPALVEAMQRKEFLGQVDESCARLGAELGVPRLGIAPLFGTSQCMGFVLVARNSVATSLDPFTGDLMRTLSVQCALALERMVERESLRDASLLDELTGLGNRRKAGLRLEKLAAGDALIAIDLDYFKRVNDTHGHAAGDRVLQGLGSYLAGSLRDGDEAFRLGGEEFLVVVERAAEDAEAIAERLRAGWDLREELTSFSAGVAIHPVGRSAEETLDAADGALYEAKRGGRNRVAVAG